VAKIVVAGLCLSSWDTLRTRLRVVGRTVILTNSFIVARLLAVVATAANAGSTAAFFGVA